MFVSRLLQVTCVYNDRSVYIWDTHDLKRVGKAWSFLYHSGCIWSLEVSTDFITLYSLTPDTYSDKSVVKPYQTQLSNTGVDVLLYFKILSFVINSILILNHLIVIKTYFTNWMKWCPSYQIYPQLEEGVKAQLPPGSFLTASADDTIRVWNLNTHMPEDTSYRRNIYSNVSF